ncbi:putative prophage CP4-6 integrase [Candidatus Accumulibacter aalborgensis]|uniref:Putative prophage CP4-6 integrase n=1 Tax=Candidatus Accumulibacter aalborgensis TaxID=1860102 RepID=A0A1A8XYP6_9PROT|nr:integrase family protein [Candidatus Accumulibacter aalborgensis]SBT09826.1 putative prophage CP4-6 integrase [Candidatus Accumulibacter aalborgensis]
MNRERLTPDRIRRLTLPEGAGQSFLWDTDAPRLAVRVTAGAKAFIFESKLNRQTIRVTIGDVRTWTLAAARDEARRLQAMTDQGTDPRQEKRDRIAATEAKRAEDEAKRIELERTATPAMKAWQKYIEARRPIWSARHLLEHEAVIKEGGKRRTQGRRPGESDKTLPGILRPLLVLPLEQIDADRVRVWLKDEATHRPTYARLSFALMRAFLNWCSDRPEYRDQVQAGACITRLAKDELPKKIAKDDCLQREQLPAWFAAVRQIGNPVIAAYLQAALLTGARREEVAGIRWEDVDFQWKAMTIRDKVEGTRNIPLTPYVATLLAGLPRRNDWVFSSPAAASGRLQEPRIMHNKALTAAGLPALSIHGLRRSFGTLAEWVECPAGVSAQIMGHKPSATAEKHYRVRPLDLLRQWHTKIEGWILNEAGIEQPAEDRAPGLRVVT